jgi:GTP:adenosylcobinamide-phosphate guanylyltransferase
MSDPIPAVVLAGGRNKPEMAAATGVEMRALIPIGGRPMLEHVLDALSAAESIGEITVVGAAPSSNGFRHIADRGGFVENIYSGLEQVHSDNAVISTSDIPFVTAESVDDFVRLARVEGADIIYPIVRVEDCYSRFPGVKRTAVRLNEGSYTGGNIMLVRRAFMEAQRERLARAYALRKSPLKLALMVGFGTTFKLALSIAMRKPMLSISELESAISRVVGGKARAVISRYPELATDIDRESDLLAVEAAKTPPVI